jgi:hypothetical protein
MASALPKIERLTIKFNPKETDQIEVLNNLYYNSWVYLLCKVVVK